GWEDNNAGLVARMLEETQTSSYHGFEWFYWQRQLHLASITLRTHSKSVNCIAVSPDGRRLVSASADQTLKLWDITSAGDPRALRTFAGHTGSVYTAAFSFDGEWVASGGEDNAVHIWETATGREIRRLAGPTRGVAAVGFSPDGRRVVAGGENN